MRPAKYCLPAALSLVLVAGFLCSQVCAFNCAFNGCSVSFSVPVQKSTNENGHCHRHKENPTPQKQNDSHQCAGHFDAVGLLSSGTSAPSSGRTPFVHGLTNESFLHLTASAKWRKDSLVSPCTKGVLPD